MPLAGPIPTSCSPAVPASRPSPWPAASAAARAIGRGRARCGEPALRPDAAELLASKLRAGGLSARGLHKVTRVARTVAALAGADVVSFAHASEALSLRAGRAVVVA